MTEPKKEIDDAPPAGEVRWFAKPNGRLYEHEKRPTKKMAKRRRRGTTVKAQTWYYAVQKASAKLGLAPEHIHIERKEEHEQGTVAPPLREDGER